jgi:hypothetical protein
MEASGFVGIVTLAVAQTDTWHAVWLLFLLTSIGVSWWSLSHRPTFRSAVAVSVAFVMLCGALGLWLNAISMQRVALYDYAGAIVSTAGAISSLREPVEVSLERLEQAGVVDSLEPPARTLWLATYFAITTVTCLVMGTRILAVRRRRLHRTAANGSEN